MYPVSSLKIRFYSYLVENSQKATLNFYFKLRFSVKPSKFQIYFAKGFDDCGCETEHRIVATVCSIHKLNLIGFARNYFASVTCSCRNLDRNEICKHCKCLQEALNTKVRKICLEKENLPKDFKYFDVHKCLEWKVPGDPIFYFNHIDNNIQLRLDSIDWPGFFIGRKTM